MKRSNVKTHTKKSTKHVPSKLPKQTASALAIANHPTGSRGEDYPAGSPLREQMRS